MAPPSPQHVTLEDVTVAEAYLALLKDRGIDYLFANAGSDFGPIIEGLTKAQTTGSAAPTPVTCPHENTALHMAIGYALVTGRPQAVMVHTNVGTANGLLGLMNAARGFVPMLYSAGRTPINEEGFQGHRDMDINWTQEMFDQAGMLRESVKWDYELRNGDQLEAVVDRLFQMMLAEPQGPVYLTLPREAIAQRMERFSYASPTRRRPAAPPAPDPEALEEAAALLAGAENPLIVTGWAGRRGDVMETLGALASRYAIPVVQYRARFISIASDHEMNMGGELQPFLGEADAILVLDSPVPWLPHAHKLKDGCKVVQLGPDPNFGFIPIRGHRTDLAITSRTGLGLQMLSEAMAAPAKHNQARIDARRATLAERRAEREAKLGKALTESRSKSPIDPVYLSHCLSEIKGEDDIIANESGLRHDHVKTSKPLTTLNATAASGLGAGIGTALGAKLAAPDRLVIGAYGDGAYMFGNPVASHYVSAEMDLPVLHVVFTNSVWQAVRNSTNRVMPGGYAEKSNRPPLTFLDSANKFEKVVAVADGYGERVEDPDELMPALERALKAVTVEKRQALLNVVCRS